MNQLDPAGLDCLAALADHASFERAAQRLTISQSAVSQRLRALEAQVGTVLVVRSRPLKPTSAGRLLLKHTKMLRLLRADLERDLKELAPSSLGGAREEERISIAINADSIATWALPALDRLARQGVPLEIITDDQDFTQEWLRGGQVLGCVTTVKQALRGCKVVPLGAMRYVAIAAPAFAGHWFGDGFSVEAARLAPAVVSDGDMMAGFLREVLDLHGPYPHHSLPWSAAFGECIYGSLAYGLMPQMQVSGALADGRLVDLAPGRHADVELNWHAWNLDTPFTRALSEQIVATARRFLL